MWFLFLVDTNLKDEVIALGIIIYLYPYILLIFRPILIFHVIYTFLTICTILETQITTLELKSNCEQYLFYCIIENKRKCCYKYIRDAIVKSLMLIWQLKYNFYQCYIFWYFSVDVKLLDSRQHILFFDKLLCKVLHGNVENNFVRFSGELCIKYNIEMHICGGKYEYCLVCICCHICQTVCVI